MSRSAKKAPEPESDSDWDSLPGDVSEAITNPDPKPAKPHSPMPPKQPSTTQPVGKQHVTTKPVNMYKSNAAKRGATVFEDRSGGQWEDMDSSGGRQDSGGSRSVHTSKDHLGGSQHGSSTTSSKLSKQSHQQETKQPPYTDFKEALSSPVPPVTTKSKDHSHSGMNQAYKIESEDDIQLDANHDNWDDSEQETNMRDSEHHYSALKDNTSVMKSQQAILNNNYHEQRRHDSVHNTNTSKQNFMRECVSNEQDMQNREMKYEQLYFDIGNKNLQFENCCMIKVENGPIDERYRPSFYHGTTNHFHVREDEPKATVSNFAKKSEIFFQRFWREIFGALQIFINFFAIFFLEFYKAVIHTLRYFISGILYTTGDYLTKPVLAAIFNNIIQPFSILLLNIFAIARNLLRPILELTKECCVQISIPLRAFRLFEVNWNTNNSGYNPSTDLKTV